MDAEPAAFERLGIPVEATRVLTGPFAYRPDASPPEPSQEPHLTMVTLTARLDHGDADAFLAALRDDYDPTLADAGMRLVSRFRTIDGVYEQTEIQSTWEMPSVAHYNHVRFFCSADPRWQRFVAEAMPLVKGGTRRLSRAV